MRPFVLFRELGLSALCVLVLLALIELGLRTDYVYSRLPLARPYYSYDVTRRVHYLDQLMRDRDRLDVLFVGSSVVRANIDPPVFDEALQKLTKRPITSFNVGLSSMFPHGTALYLKNLWLRRARPRFVLHGVREAELASKQRANYNLKHGRLESLWLDDSPEAAVAAALLGELRLLQYRGTLNTVLARFAAGTPLHVREPGEIIASDRGYRRETTPLKVKKKGKSKRLWKYSRPAKPGRYKLSFAAMEDMRQRCIAAGCTYVLVHMPEHPERFGHEHGPAVWSDYQLQVHTWAQTHGVPFIDASDGTLEAFGKDGYFSDYHHMTRAGARRLSERVAERFAKLYAAARP